MRMVLGIAAVKDWELRQLDVDMAHLEAKVKEEPCIELPEDYRDSCDQVGNIRLCARQIIMVKNVQR